MVGAPLDTGPAEGEDDAAGFPVPGEDGAGDASPPAVGAVVVDGVDDNVEAGPDDGVDDGTEDEVLGEIDAVAKLGEVEAVVVFEEAEGVDEGVGGAMGEGADDGTADVSGLGDMDAVAELGEVDAVVVLEEADVARLGAPDVPGLREVDDATLGADERGAAVDRANAVGVGTLLAEGRPVPGAVGAAVPKSTRDTSSRNTAPRWFGPAGRKAETPTGLYRYENVTACGPGSRTISWASNVVMFENEPRSRSST